MSKLSPREKFMAAVNLESSVPAPCSFMLYKGLLMNGGSYIEFLQSQLQMGLEPYAMIPPRPPIVINDHYNLHGMQVRLDPAVEIREWIEERAGEKFPVMIKEYYTPAGKLRAEVRQTDDWRWGNHIPLFDDYISPRAVKYIVNGSEDLNALRYLLCTPSAGEIDALRAESEDVINFARQNNLPLVGGWGIGADMLGWIYGFEQMVFSSLDQPAFLHEILRIIADWNQARMRALLDMGIDLYIKRTWYETCNFWSPKTFEKFIAPILKEDSDICHAAGVKFGFIATDKAMPLLKFYPQLGVDVLIGIDPHTYDLQKTKEILKGKVCLWGGVNGHLTVEMGSEEETRAETRNALEVLGAEGGFILSPVDNVREDTQLSRKNVEALINEWKKFYQK